MMCIIMISTICAFDFRLKRGFGFTILESVALSYVVRDFSLWLLSRSDACPFLPVEPICPAARDGCHGPYGDAGTLVPRVLEA